MHLWFFFYDFEECLYVESEELKLCWPQSHENFSQFNTKTSECHQWDLLKRSPSPVPRRQNIFVSFGTHFCFSLVKSHISSRNLYFIVVIVFIDINTKHEFKSGFAGLKCLSQWIHFSVTFSQQLSSIRSPFISKLQ